MDIVGNYTLVGVDYSPEFRIESSRRATRKPKSKTPSVTTKKSAIIKETASTDKGATNLAIDLTSGVYEINLLPGSLPLTMPTPDSFVLPSFAGAERKQPSILGKRKLPDRHSDTESTKSDYSEYIKGRAPQRR